MNSYTEAFDVSYLNVDGEPEPVIRLIEETEGVVRLQFRPIWQEDSRVISFDLSVPLVTPVPFAGDGGLHGHVVRLPHSRTSRFCHPLLVCGFAESIVAGLSARQSNDRLKAIAIYRNATPEDWQFEWVSWYGRINKMAEDVVSKLMASQQKLTVGFIRMQFRRGISQLITPNDNQIRPTSWMENGSNNCSGLPVSDECMIYRQMYEVRLGYPDVPNNDRMYEALKMKYVAAVDGFCDVCWTSKNHTGREVGRIFEGDPISFITGRPMPRLLRGMNPLAQIASPARVWRENRSCSGWLTFENPEKPPLTAKGVSLPVEFEKRITTLVTAIVDIPGFNVFEADDQDLRDFPLRVKEGEEISLDGLLITQTGQRKLQAQVVSKESMNAENFLLRMEEFKERPGFQFEEDPQEVETLSDGTRVFNYQYRYSYDRAVRCGYDKVKCLCGGIKGVTRPIPRQLFTEIGGEVMAIDMVISERTALSKGAKDMFLYPILAHAGLTEIDPAWSMEELVQRAESGLRERDLPLDGRFPIYSSRRVYEHKGEVLDAATANCLRALGVAVQSRMERTQVGWGIVGPLPFVRAQETEHRQSSASQGMSLNSHSRVLGGVPLPIDERTEQLVEKTTRFFYDNAPLASVMSMEAETVDSL